MGQQREPPWLCCVSPRIPEGEGDSMRTIKAGCNCGKTVAAQSFIYTAPDGKQVTYKTEIEARAAQIRNGGGTIATITK